MKAITLERLGDPVRDPGLLSLREVAKPTPEPGEAIIRIALAPINPSDLLFMAGELPWPVRLRPGQIVGICGAGFVESSAESGPPVDTLVTFSAMGSWAEYVAVPAASLIALPPDFPLALAAQFANVITAWELVEQSGVEPGGWLALTAGYSTVSILALQLAVRKGINVVSVVRTRRANPDLIALGAKAILITQEGGLGEAVWQATGGKGLNGIVDCVAGPATVELIRQCAPFSRMQIYGSLDSRDMAIAGHDILYRFLEIRPYSYPFSFRPPATAEENAFVNRVVQEALSVRPYVPVGGIFPMADYRNAIAGPMTAEERGKYFLRMID